MDLRKNRSLFKENYKTLTNLNSKFMKSLFRLLVIIRVQRETFKLNLYILKSSQQNLVLEVYVYKVNSCGNPYPIIQKQQKILKFPKKLLNFGMKRPVVATFTKFTGRDFFYRMTALVLAIDVNEKLRSVQIYSYTIYLL